MNTNTNTKSPFASAPLLCALLCLLLALLTLLTGCLTFKNPKAAADVAQYVARNTTRKVLEKNPAALPKFETARDALAKLEAAETIDALAVVQIIQELPVQELQTADGQMYIEGGALVIILLGDPALKTDTAERTRQIVHGLVAGMTEGINWFKAFKSGKADRQVGPTGRAALLRGQPIPL